MERFEIHTSVITKMVSNKEEAISTAKKLSLRYGRATVWSGYERIATYRNGLKK